MSRVRRHAAQQDQWPAAYPDPEDIPSTQVADDHNGHDAEARTEEFADTEACDSESELEPRERSRSPRHTRSES